MADLRNFFKMRTIPHRIPPELPEDIYETIALNIDDPITYRNFLLANRTTYRRGTPLRQQKREEFFREEIIPREYGGYMYKRYNVNNENTYYYQLLDDDNKVSEEGYIVNGKIEGERKNYYRFGGISSVTNHRNGKLHGIHRSYHPSGEIETESSYVNGVKEGGEREYRDDGSLMQEGQYRGGYPQGIWKRYFPSGNRRSEVIYEDGMLQGLSVTYYGGDPPKVKEVKNYNRNRLHGLYSKYYLTGEVEARAEFRNGKMIKPWTYYTKEGQVEDRSQREEELRKWAQDTFDELMNQ